MSPSGLRKIAYANSIACPRGGYWCLKFTISNNRTSDRPHWLRNHHRAKLKIDANVTSLSVVRDLGEACLPRSAVCEYRGASLVLLDLRVTRAPVTGRSVGRSSTDRVGRRSSASIGRRFARPARRPQARRQSHDIWWHNWVPQRSTTCQGINKIFIF